jgi:nicotinate phosphoribosyltransferase
MSDLNDRRFWIAKEEEIMQGKTTDVYFLYTKQVLEYAKMNPRVAIEVFARHVKDNWGIVLGIYEVAKLLEGKDVNVKAMDEGEIFLTSQSPIYEPVMQIEANYADIAILENPILGFLCSSSGIASKAARIRLAAGDKAVLFSFGTRRAHPALAPMIERAIYIAGFDGVSNVLASDLMHIDAIGTMPHALILAFGDQRDAWKAFDAAIPEYVKRIALIDTLYDEKAEAIMALEALGKRLYGVRLDTPSSRRGNMRKIVEEVRWELSIRDGGHVKIFVSGGLDEQEVAELRDVVDGFGVGTSVSASPPIDFSFKIVEVNGKPIAKRGDLAGRKSVYRRGFNDIVTLADSKVSRYLEEHGYEPLLKDLIVNGKIVREFKSIEQLRLDVKKRLGEFSKAEHSVSWML